MKRLILIVLALSIALSAVGMVGAQEPDDAPPVTQEDGERPQRGERDGQRGNRGNKFADIAEAPDLEP